MSLETHPPNKEKDKDNRFKHTSRLLPALQILSNPGMFNGRWTRVVAAVSLPLSLARSRMVVTPLYHSRDLAKLALQVILIAIVMVREEILLCKRCIYTYA
jgi:hypothetical protein